MEDDIEIHHQEKNMRKVTGLLNVGTGTRGGDF
jgi:hypothetical protein